MAALKRPELGPSAGYIRTSPLADLRAERAARTSTGALQLQTPQKLTHHQDSVDSSLVTPPKDQWQSHPRQRQIEQVEEIRHSPKCLLLHGRLDRKDENVEPLRQPEVVRDNQKPPTCAWRSRVQERIRGVRILSPENDASAWCWKDLPMEVRNALRFLNGLPDLPQTFGARPLLPSLPEAEKPTPVLDLDETLVHCSRANSMPDARMAPDLIVEFDDSPCPGRVHFRPFAQIFLEVIARTFEVVVFTASQQSYADQVIDALDPRRAFVSHRLYRQHCTEYHGAYFKELGLLGRSFSKCVLIDNSPVALACNGENGVLIRSWYGDLKDQELLALLEVLEDMRRLSARGCGFDRYLSQPNLHSYLQVPLSVPLDTRDWQG